jgi:asparagine synthase (glutamine-hydrolysing)
MLANRGIWRQMANRGIKVSLNGAAGDESWCGYFNDYFAPFLRHAATSGDVLTLLRSCRLFGDRPSPVTSREFWRRIGGAMRRPGAAGKVSSPGSRQYMLDPRDNPLKINATAQGGPAPDLLGLTRDLMGPWRMNYWLRSANQSYMSVPTELRCPFLDYRLVELAFSLPVTYLMRDGWTKWLVRKAMADRLPAAVTWRKRKMGFPFPYCQWAAASKGRFFDAVGRLDCPFVDPVMLVASYDRLAKENPLFLWRVMSLCLWWKRCVVGERLDVGARGPVVMKTAA